MEVDTTDTKAGLMDIKAYAARVCHTLVAHFHSAKLADMQLKAIGIVADSFARGKEEGSMKDEDAPSNELLEEMMCKLLEICYHPRKEFMLERLHYANAEFQGISAGLRKTKKRKPSAK